MKASVTLHIEPFTVPSFVIARSDKNKSDQIRLELSELDEYDLKALCDEFTDAVFQKAGKPHRPEEIAG